MRADLTSTALAYESNRYRLTRLVAKATRMLHRPQHTCAGYDGRRVQVVRLLQTRSSRHVAEAISCSASGPT
jgi:hypothetical protein